MPEWNLADLYAGIDDPRVKRDLDRADAESIAFEEAYKGKLAALTQGPDAGPALAEAVKRYEALDDLLGRLVLAGLVHAGDTVDPARAKFYADVQERITAASTHLLFFVLELNRLDDHKLERAMQDPALGHYRPWLEDIRKEKPYQLEDRIEQLFHEKSVTGLFGLEPAVRRDHRQPALQGRDEVARHRADAQPDAGSEGGARKAASQALAKTFKENLRTFALITNILAKDKEISDRWRGFADVADARHLSNRVEPEVVEALVAAVRAAYPRLSHRYYALKARWFGKKRCRTGTATRRCPRSRPHHRLDRGARHRCSPPTARSRRGWRRSPSASSTRQLDRCAGAARQGARRLRAPDRAVGASLRAAQLPGQAARRDDARARARPRRAPGAGGAERRADGADAADAGRDRERVRRDAHLPRRARRPPTKRSSARRCSPPRSRT